MGNSKKLHFINPKQICFNPFTSVHRVKMPLKSIQRLLRVSLRRGGDGRWVLFFAVSERPTFRLQQLPVQQYTEPVSGTTEFCGRDDAAKNGWLSLYAFHPCAVVPSIDVILIFWATMVSGVMYLHVAFPRLLSTS